MPFLESEVSTIKSKSLPIVPEPAAEELPPEPSTPVAPYSDRSGSDRRFPHFSQDWSDYLPIFPSPLRQSFGPSDFEEADDRSELGYSKPTPPDDYRQSDRFEETLFSDWECDASFETEYISMSYRPTLDPIKQAKLHMKALERSTEDRFIGNQTKSTVETKTQFERLTDQKEREAWWHENMTMAYPLSGIQ